MLNLVSTETVRVLNISKQMLYSIYSLIYNLLDAVELLDVDVFVFQLLSFFSFYFFLCK